MSREGLLELEIDGGAIGEEAFARLAEGLASDGCAVECAPDGAPVRFRLWSRREPGARERLIAGCALAGLPAAAFRIREVADDEWATAWQEAWRPIRVGRRLWVRPAFREAAPPELVDVVLTPGMAFGTGAHPTTRLCLEMVEEACAEAPPASVLDMGCGSGILAIAAAKLGARGVCAVDRERAAVEACRENARANGVGLEVLRRDAPPPGRRFELVVANILLEPLLAMARELSGCVAGRLVLSGLLAEQGERAAAAYRAHGLALESQRRDGEWVALSFSAPENENGPRRGPSAASG